MTTAEPDSKRWDVIVVGAGPAGCAAAVAARRERPGARVLLLDRADFPRDKVCGDGIAAEALDVLAELGMDAAAIAEGYPPVERLRLTAPGGAEVERRMTRAAHVIPRRVLDARIVTEAQRQGVVLRRHTVRSVAAHPHGVSVDGFEADVVVGADGAESVVRRALHPAPPAGTVALAFRAYADEPVGQIGTQVITMTSAHWPAYAWSFPDGTGRVNVGYGEVLTAAPPSRATMLKRWEALVPATGERDALRAHRLPLSTGRPPIPDGRIVLVGDAQCLINPLTGEGIFYAARSGQLAGRAALAGAQAGAVYRRAMRRALGRHFRHTTLLARITRTPLLLDAAVRACRRDQRVFDDLLRIGLADGLLTPRLVTNLWR